MSDWKPASTPATPPATPPATVPATPPPAAPAAPVTSGEEYFNSSRLKIIGTITAAVVAVGALGGIAGVAFDPDPVREGTHVQPGQGGGTLDPQEVDPGSPGNSVAGRGVFRAPSAQVTSPSAVSSASPGTGGFSESPTSSPTVPGPSPSPTPGGGGTTGGGPALDNGVQIYVPDGWTIDHQTESQAYLSDGNGDYAFIFTGSADPSTAAGSVISENLDAILPPESYTQLQTSEITDIPAFGSVVSVAFNEYEALWVDNQGSVSIHGQIYVGIRQDGTVLGVNIEHIPAEDWQASFPDMAPVVDGTFNLFAGLG